MKLGVITMKVESAKQIPRRWHCHIRYLELVSQFGESVSRDNTTSEIDTGIACDRVVPLVPRSLWSQPH